MSDAELHALAERLRGHVEALAATARPPGTAAHTQAREYVFDHLGRAGFVVEEQVYRDVNGECINLTTQPFPHDEKLPLVIIGAHYDSVYNSPGADDNASAVAGLIELAHWIGPRLPVEACHARLQLAAYDLEEYGLIGSDLHGREIKAADVPFRGMISLEMLGYTNHRKGSQQMPAFLRGMYPDVANFIGVVGNQKSIALLRVVAEALRAVPGLPVEHLEVPGDGHLLPQTRLSDHSSFWDQGYPALMITDTSFFRNPHYHQVSDTPDTLDYPFLARVTVGVCEAALRLVRDERLG
jgi:Zn-dependent M28 family amino/carboxypeptidase